MACGGTVSGGRPSSTSIRGLRNSRAVTSAETGLPGRPMTCSLPLRPYMKGLPGRMAIFQKPIVDAAGLEGFLHIVVVTHRCATRGEQDVALQALAHSRFGGGKCVGHDAEIADRCAQWLPPWRQGHGCWMSDLVGPRLLTGQHKFIARGEQDHMRLASEHGVLRHWPQRQGRCHAGEARLRVQQRSPLVKSSPGRRMFLPRAVGLSTVRMSPSRQVFS